MKNTPPPITEEPGFEQLSTRTRLILLEGKFSSRSEVREAILDGKLRPTQGLIPTTHRKYGKKCHGELCRWVGIGGVVRARMEPCICIHIADGFESQLDHGTFLKTIPHTSKPRTKKK